MPIRWIVLLAFIAAVAGGSFFAGHHIEALKFEVFKSQQAAVAEKAAADSAQHARQIEQDAAVKLAATEADYQGQLHDQQQTYEAAMRGAANGSVGLFVHTRSCATVVPKTGASTERSDDAGTAQLSSDTAQFLISESHRADGYAAQVNALRAVIAQDRQICNGAVP